jgi:hypothetical protein
MKRKEERHYVTILSNLIRGNKDKNLDFLLSNSW